MLDQLVDDAKLFLMSTHNQHSCWMFVNAINESFRDDGGMDWIDTEAYRIDDEGQSYYNNTHTGELTKLAKLLTGDKS